MKPNVLFKKNRFALLLFLMLFSTILFIASIYFISFLLGPPELTTEQNTIYYSKTEEVIGEERGTENRYSVDLGDIPDHVVDATLAIEDQHFYDHHGFDIKRIAGAALADIKSLSLKEGASTLTQQYARNLFLTHEKTWTRKIKEAFYTVRLEMYYSKDELLNGYLNTIYYGHGAYGIEAASRYFFNKHADELTVAEAAMLAGIPKGPSYYSPINNYDKAKERQHNILKQLLNQDKISASTYEAAKEEQLNFHQTENTQNKAIGPYFQDIALKEAANILQIDEEIVRSSGYRIYTTLNIEKQHALEEKIKETITDHSEINIGSIALNPSNGEIEALVGGKSYENSPFNRAISAQRMPGSTFKPFLYYTALEHNYTASTKLLSEPTTFHLEDKEEYKPQNYNGYYADEQITLAQALALSDNIYAVKTNLFLGPEKLVQTAKTFGISSSLPAVPSLALGTATVSVYEMVTSYGMLANGGQEIHGHTVEKIIDKYGQTVFDKREDSSGMKQKLDPIPVFILTNLMTGMFDRSLDGYMPVTGASIADKLTRPYAGKSGSTPYDSWMIGYSPSLVTGVWTGYDDNRPMEKMNERAYAKDIWAAFMEAAHKNENKQGFSVPQGVVTLAIDPQTGDQATPYCPSARTMYFAKGTEPAHFCQEHLPTDQPKEDMDKNEEQKGLLKRLFDKFR